MLGSIDMGYQSEIVIQRVTTTVPPEDKPIFNEETMHEHEELLKLYQVKPEHNITQTLWLTEMGDQVNDLE